MNELFISFQVAFRFPIPLYLCPEKINCPGWLQMVHTVTEYVSRTTSKLSCYFMVLVRSMNQSSFKINVTNFNPFYLSLRRTKQFVCLPVCRHFRSLWYRHQVLPMVIGSFPYLSNGVFLHLIQPPLYSFFVHWISVSLYVFFFALFLSPRALFAPLPLTVHGHFYRLCSSFHEKGGKKGADKSGRPYSIRTSEL